MGARGVTYDGVDELSRSTSRRNRFHLAAFLIACGLMAGGPAVAVASAGTGETASSSPTGAGSAAADQKPGGTTPDRPAPTRQTGTDTRNRTSTVAANSGSAHPRATSTRLSTAIGRLADTAGRYHSNLPPAPASDLPTGAMLPARRGTSPSAAVGGARPLEAAKRHATRTPNFTGWAVGASNDFSGGYATILKIDTKNNGFQTVSRQGDPVQFAGITLQGVAAVSPRIAWIAGQAADRSGAIFRTTDGGVTWKPQGVDQQLEGLYGLTAINRYTAWAVGESGSVYFTRNGGRRWTQVGSPDNLPTGGALQGVFAPALNGNGRVWVTGTGDVAPNSIQIFRSPNSAALYLPAITWSATTDTATCTVECKMLSVTGNSTGRKLFAVGGKPYTVVASADSGRHWVQQTLPNAGGDNDANSVVTLDGTNAWIVADYGNTWWTDNGGAQWNKVRVPGASGSFLLGVSTADNQHLWAVGSQNGRGVVAESSDAGRTWETLGGAAIPDTGGLWKVSVVSNCALRR